MSSDGEKDIEPTLDRWHEVIREDLRRNRVLLVHRLCEVRDDFRVR